MSVNLVFTDYTKDVLEYLGSKLPDIPAATLMEIAEYLGNKSTILVMDAIYERDKEWDRVGIKRTYRRSYDPGSQRDT
jgi:hypothetical protein